MDKLIETRKERFKFVEAQHRDQWVRAQAAKLPSGTYILDAGAGSSKYRPLFAHCRYETQDFCQYKGELVKYLQPIDHVCEITNILLPDASLDAILCTEVLEHVTDPMAVLAEFSRLLKPGGKLLLTAPSACFLHMEPYHFYGGLTRFWYQHWLPRRGFVLDSLTPYGGPGRFAVVSLQAQYDSWTRWAESGGRLRKPLLLLAKLLSKIPVHYVLPWLLPRLDSKESVDRVSIGLMVEATRLTAVTEDGHGSV